MMVFYMVVDLHPELYVVNYVCMCIYMCVCVYVYICIYIHTHTYFFYFATLVACGSS